MPTTHASNRADRRRQQHRSGRAGPSLAGTIRGRLELKRVARRSVATWVADGLAVADLRVLRRELVAELDAAIERGTRPGA